MRLTTDEAARELAVSIDKLINFLVTITLIDMMVTVGLRVTFAEIAYTAKNWHLVTRALVANYLAVPLVAIALLLLFRSIRWWPQGFSCWQSARELPTDRRSRGLHTPMRHPQ